MYFVWFSQNINHTRVLIGFLSICFQHQFMYLLWRDVCTGSRTSGIGPRCSRRCHTGGRPWCRSPRGRIRLFRCSIQEGRRSRQIPYMAFPQLWAKNRSITGKELPTPLPFLIFNFPIFNADLAIVAAAPLSTSRPRRKPAGGGVAALIIALLCGIKREDDKWGVAKIETTQSFPLWKFSRVDEIYSTSGLPQSHCSPSSSQPLPHSAILIKSDGDGWFFRHTPPPRMINDSKSSALQVLKVVEPLESDREDNSHAKTYLTDTVSVYPRKTAFSSSHEHEFVFLWRATFFKA